MAFVSLSIKADSERRLGRLGWRVFNAFIVFMADAAAALYFLFVEDVIGCGDDPALILKVLSNASDANDDLCLYFKLAFLLAFECSPAL